MSDGDEAGDGDASPGDAHPDATRPSVVRRGQAWALPELAHSVHVEVDGLRPDREWFYRFRYRHDPSPVGRTRTAPRPGSSGDSLAFASASCQAWDNGFYPSYRHMAGEDLDLVLHLGDYVYEGGIPADGGYRQTPTPEVLREAQLDVVDGRQFRSVPPCGWGEAQACEAAYDPEITMLGQRQERWLYQGSPRLGPAGTSSATT